MTLAAHTAAGQAAGYLFQPERALYWLAECPRGSSVGIETEDDVVVRHADGTAVHEQQKSTVQADGAPFGDRSIDLWKTLSIWVDAVRSGEIVLPKTSLYLTTNAALPDCIVKRLGRPDRKVDALITELRAAGVDSPTTFSKKVSNVLAASDSLLAQLLERIKVADATDATAGDALRNKVAGLLHLSDAQPWDDLLHALGGWVHAEALRAWRSQRPAVITRSAFDTQLNRLQVVHHQGARRARPAHQIPVTTAQIDELRDSTFVKQLHAVDVLNGDELIDDSIQDFVRFGIEQFRLSGAGDLTRADVEAFDENLERRWKEHCRRHHGGSQSTVTDRQCCDAGYQVLLAAMEHREPLAGVTQEPYMTTGGFHRLADVVRIWWHPKWKVLSEEANDSSEIQGNQEALADAAST